MRIIEADVGLDHVLANQPSEEFGWFCMDEHVRWQFGVPPKGNVNFA
ncbi:MAG: hypothetical protein ABMA26_05675 [Limisphaerales bacterium]